jgi:hypothetical protein
MRVRSPTVLQYNFKELCDAYENTATHNDYIHALFTELTENDAQLKGHRAHIEVNKLGFGDSAFHSMWLLLFEEARQRFEDNRALEIGVYKGQVISLWTLLRARLNMKVEIEAITPLEGQPVPRFSRLRMLFSRKIRKNMESANYYDQADYERIIEQLFRRFGLDFAAITLYRGYSGDAMIVKTVKERRYTIVYIDGDHSIEGAKRDFETFGPLVQKGGWLVADDASYFLPGATFWKGHESVSRVVELLPALGFKNVLNVGHNRIFERN